MRVGIVGAGLQARRRGPVVSMFPDCEVVAITSKEPELSVALSKNLKCKVTNSWKELLKENLDALIVCTYPDSHAEISIEAMKNGVHVLCEKPLARTEDECLKMIETAKNNDVILKCGFNHRHHPAIMSAKKWHDEGNLGKINFIRCKYGYCGRPGMEKEWRNNPNIVAGGQLMEQGIHAVDLMRWFLGEQEEVSCFTSTQYWKIEPLEDNASVIFKTKNGQITNIHSSLTQWKNNFTFEIFGADGYAIIDGLGGSYGVEQLILGKRNFSGPFEDTRMEFRGEDKSWYEEWKEFVTAIKEKREPLGNGYDGLQSIRLVLAAYRSAKEKKIIIL